MLPVVAAGACVEGVERRLDLRGHGRMRPRQCHGRAPSGRRAHAGAGRFQLGAAPSTVFQTLPDHNPSQIQASNLSTLHALPVGSAPAPSPWRLCTQWQSAHLRVCAALLTRKALLAGVSCTAGLGCWRHLLRKASPLGMLHFVSLLQTVRSTQLQHSRSSWTRTASGRAAQPPKPSSPGCTNLGHTQFLHP